MSQNAAACPSLSIGRCVMEMSDNNKLTTGVIILAAGFIILLGKLGVFAVLGKALWPLLLLIPGILLHLWHFWRNGPSELLIPGGILVVYGLLFYVGVIGGWDTMANVWPGFILGIAVGLFEYDTFSRQRQRGVLAAALVLAAISVALLGWTLFSLSIIYLLALALIIGGVWLILTRGNRRSNW